MSLAALIGKKINQTQGFLEDGTRVPLSVIAMNKNIVAQVKTEEHEGYNAVKLGFGIKNKLNKAEAGFIKKAGLEKAPRFFSEVRVDKIDVEQGAQIGPEEVFEPGDLVDVTGTSKGKGYAGVVKRHHFSGGPKTHGQSDRHRAPGSSGQGTTPGRVYKGKRMSGRMGNEQVTVKNLEVLNVDGELVYVKGLVPGIKGSILMVKKVGKNKKFRPLFKSQTEEIIEEVVQEEPPVVVAEENIEAPAETVEAENVETAEENVKSEAETKELPVEEVKEESKEENGGN